MAANPSVKAVVGRDDADNQKIMKIARAGDILIETDDFPGPVTLCRGPFTEELLRKAGAITARYGKGKDQPEVAVTCSAIGGSCCPRHTEGGQVGVEQLSFRVAPREYTDVGAVRIGEPERRH